MAPRGCCGTVSEEDEAIAGTRPQHGSQSLLGKVGQHWHGAGSDNK